ncbi:hypothetical protein ACP70R_039891 [Stipagrostis hirtigluma subsp. patula]
MSLIPCDGCLTKGYPPVDAVGSPGRGEPLWFLLSKRTVMTDGLMNVLDHAWQESDKDYPLYGFSLTTGQALGAMFFSRDFSGFMHNGHQQVYQWLATFRPHKRTEAGHHSLIGRDGHNCFAVGQSYLVPARQHVFGSFVIPRQVEKLYQMREGQNVSFLDCAGRILTTRVQKVGELFALGEGWPEVIAWFGAVQGDYILFQLQICCAAKMFVFTNEGRQKPPGIGYRSKPPNSSASTQISGCVGEQVTSEFASCFLDPKKLEVLLIDAFGRVYNVVIVTVFGEYYLSGGWAEFMREHGAMNGDIALFEFRGTQCFDVTVFNQHRSKAGTTEEASAVSVRAFSRSPPPSGIVGSSDVGIRDWVFAGEGAEAGPELLAMVREICGGLKPIIPLYFCKMGFVPIDFGQLVGPQVDVKHEPPHLRENTTRDSKRSVVLAFFVFFRGVDQVRSFKKTSGHQTRVSVLRPKVVAGPLLADCEFSFLGGHQWHSQVAVHSCELLAFVAHQLGMAFVAGAVGGVRVPAAWNYGAVERALRESGNRQGENIFQPCVGKYGRSRVNKGGKRTKQDIVCTCEGRDSSVDARSVRTGCGAMIRLLLGDDDSWYISKFEDEHNHPLSCSTGERRQWNSHNRIDQMTRDLVRHLRENNVQISRVCSILGAMHGGGDYVAFRRQSIRSLCGRLAQESIEGDMAKTVKIFTEMRERDPGMVVSFDLDDDKRIRSLFWCHGSSRDNYRCFGDVVTFDTTYRTNLYNLPFGLFVGVNHHFQSVIFGAVLLTEETIGAFQWAFRAFVEAMGAEPRTILTDQCQSMRAAIALEFPHARHRWCKWHVLRKAKESLGALYSKNFGFKVALHELLDEVVCIQEFETRWADLVDTYGLHDNQFLQRAYDNRAMWAKPYFAETFCAGMTSTQRSESANHLLKTYIPRSAPMHLFVSQYNRLIADREAEEGREEHATKQVGRAMRIGVPIERDAARVYTRAMFDRFSKELFKSGAYACGEGDGDGVYRVILLAGHADNGMTEYLVGVSPDGSQYSCECKLFEHSGLPCRHILRLLVQTGVDALPQSLVMKRWTRNAKEGMPDVGSVNRPRAPCMDPGTMQAVLYATSMELVRLCSTSRQAFDLGVEYMARAKQALSEMTIIPAQSSLQRTWDRLWRFCNIGQL